MSSNSNIFSTFFKASNNEKKIIIEICLIFSFCSSAFIGIPVWFGEPSILCQNPNTFLYEPCSEEEMCEKKFAFIINPEKSSPTLISELNLYCERKYIKQILLTVIYFGGSLGSLSNFLIFISPALRHKALAILGILFGLGNILLFLFTTSETVVALGLVMLSFTSIIANAYGFMLINEYFSGEIAQTASIFMRIFWAVFGIFFGAFCYFINSNCKILFFTMATLILLVSISFFFLKSEKGVKESSSKAPKNVLEFFKEIFRLNQIRKNFFIYVFLWAASSITYNSIWLELASLGGNFYLNMMIISTLELIASFVASFITMRFNISSSIRSVVIILIFLFGLFIFFPFSDQKSQSVLSSTLFLILMFFGKMFSETSLNLCNVHVPKVLTDRFTSSFMVFGRLFSRILLLSLPSIIYLLNAYYFHAFVFVALVWAASLFFLNFAQEIQPEGIEDILKEFKIGLVSRMSIMSSAGADYHDPDEVLNNFEVEGKSLKEIKRSRAHSIHQSLLLDEKEVKELKIVRYESFSTFKQEFEK